MARRRVAVALLPPPALCARVQALRLAVGDPRAHLLPPHLTLVPPINVAERSESSLRALLRAAAVRTDPFPLELGPAASFLPDTPTLHLNVQGDLDALRSLREALRVDPLDRPDQWPFTPHVTLRESFEPEAIPHALTTLSGTVGDWRVDRLHLLEQFRVDDLVRWEPVAEEQFGDPVVVGRGGIELVLRTTSLLEPAVAALCTTTDDDGAAEVAERSAVPATCATTLVVTAELPGEAGVPVAAAVGRASGDGAVLQLVHVAAEHRGIGIGRQATARWCLEAARRGAEWVTATRHEHDEVLRGWGFSDLGASLVRRLDPGRAE